MKVRKCRGAPDPVKARKGKPYDLSQSVGHWLTIDPGVGGTGFAVWDCERFHELVEPVDSGAIECDGSGCEWIEKVMRIGDLLRTTVCRKYVISHVFYEHPQFIEGPRGIASARDGSLVKLSLIAGVVVASAAANARVVPVPLHWKGQMNKEKTERRIRQRLPNYQATDDVDHEWDAIGIGLFIKGYFG